MSFPTLYKKQLVAALDSIDLEQVDELIRLFAQARDESRHIFVCGNGGSAATANHFACDIVKGCSYGCEQRFRIMSLSEQLPTLTAYANDVGYEHVFVEQLKNFAQPQDLVMAISGSGNSPNVVRAVEYGNRIDCRTIALTGPTGGKVGPLATLNIRVNDDHMGRIEDAHMVICHMIGYNFMDRAQEFVPVRDGEATGDPDVVEEEAKKQAP